MTKASNFFQRLGAGGTQLVELTKVFRSTPQITDFLRDLDASFPALDSSKTSGESTPGIPITLSVKYPKLVEFGTNTQLLDRVFARAKRDVAEYGVQENVAVLCLNEELFDRYR